VIIFFIDLGCILASGFFLLQFSQSCLESSERNKFKKEKDWFWSIVALATIFMFYWFFEIIAVLNNKMNLIFEISIILDLANLFSALNLFVVFVLKDDVKTLLFKKYYQNLRRNESSYYSPYV
jgi:hypothetical protein